ncbi:MAG: hypothetical protein GXP40_03595, partial [Chloroflexi bacterium]|nr:hypothetical protein [Chloroflexota bacterium]
MEQQFPKDPKRTNLPPAALHKLAQMVAQTQDVEYSCDEAYRLLDQYAETVTRGEDAERIMPLVKHHLDMCPDCREEFEALLRVLENKAA